MYLCHVFTDAPDLIRYEVKSASRNMTNAFGKITSVVWIQSLWQPTANDTGGNFFRQWRRAILLSAGATNWQIGTKSRLGEINARDDQKNGRCWLKCAYASLRKMLPIQWQESEREDASKHDASITKAQSCLLSSSVCRRANNNNPCKDVATTRMCVCVCLCVSIKIQQKTPLTFKVSR